MLRDKAAIALRYALAPACIGLAILLHITPLGSLFHPSGMFILGVVTAAWFGGCGPGVLAAFLSALALPHLIAITYPLSLDYPLLAGIFDLPRFITLGLTGAAVGWGTSKHRRAQAELETAIAERTGHLKASEERLVRAVEADITERKRAEEALRESEQRYERVMLSFRAGIWDWDVVNDEFYVSPRFLEMGGLPPDTVFSGREDFMRRGPLLPEDRERWTQAVTGLFASSESRLGMELRSIVRGETRWRRLEGICFRDAAGRVVRWTGTVTDITDGRHAEEALRSSEELLAREKQLLEMMARAMPLPAVLDALCRIVEEHLGCLCSILVVDASGARLEHGAAPSLPREYVQAIDGAAISPDVGPCGMAASLNEQVISADVATETRWTEKGWSAMALSHGLRSCWSTPIMSSAKRALGTFAIYPGHPSSPTNAHRAVIERFTHLAAVAIERSRGEAALRESEQRYERAMLAAEAGFWDWDATKDEFYVSPRFLEMGGLPPDTIFSGREDFMRRGPLHPEDRERWKQAVRELFAGSESRLSMELRAIVHGETRWRRLEGICFRDAAGHVVRWTGTATDITDRKCAEEALRLSEAFLREGQRLARVGNFAWQVREGEITWSEEIYRIFEFEPGSRITLEQIATRVHPDDIPMMLDMVERAQRRVSDFAYEHRVLMPDGRIKHIHLIAHRTSGEEDRLEYIGAVQDITARKFGEEALRLSEERYALAMEASEEGHFDWNVGTDEIFASERLKQVLGLPSDGQYRTRGDVVAHTPFYPGDRERIEQMTREVLAGSALHNEFEYRLLRGPARELRWIRVRWKIFRDANGVAQRIIGVFNDVTEMHKMGQELRRAQRLEAMGALAGGIAHDFNNILGAILGYGEMAMRGALAGTRLKRDLDNIMAAGERGRALVERILAFSRGGGGGSVPVHVEAVVREALDQVAARLPANVTIMPRLRAGRAAMLGDSTQVHQVVMNLASNAVQAMPEGGVLRVVLDSTSFDAARPATVGSIMPGDYIVLRVSDTGTGIPENVLEHIFDPFFTTKEIGVGNGLGLSLVHGIVANAGGAIDVATERGKGTTFTICLRRTGIAPEEQADGSLPLPRGEGQRVLVVDDEEPLVRLATETLEYLGYTPVGFTSSIAALAAFRADPEGFDAVITDERMPGMSGSALIREVRGIRDAIPVVLMSGYLGMESVDANIVVRKPLSARDIAASIARVCTRSPPRAS